MQWTPTAHNKAHYVFENTKNSHLVNLVSYTEVNLKGAFLCIIFITYGNISHKMRSFKMFVSDYSSNQDKLLTNKR